jgi:hypothetical protein
MRYYYKINLGDYAAINGFNDSTTDGIFYYQFGVPMRTNPTLSTTGTAGDYGIRFGGGSRQCTQVPTLTGNGSVNCVRIYTNATSLTTGYGAGLISYANTDGKYLGFSAEL